MVTEQELRDLLTSQQWRLSPIKRYQTVYYYAKRRIAGKVRTRYLTTERKINQLTEEDVLKKINS